MKRKKIIQYIVLPLLVVIAGATFYIYKEYNRTHKDTAKLKPDYTFAATDLINEFLSNEQLSNKKYWDKIIRVEGVVKDLTQDDKGFYSIALGDTSVMSSVRCSIDSIHNSSVMSIKKGTKIAIKGICSGFNADELLGSDVILVRSVVEVKK